jgi:hypothetical protein
MSDNAPNIQSITAAAIQLAAERASQTKSQLVELGEAINALPDSPEKTRLQRLKLVHHNYLNGSAVALAGFFGVPPSTLSGGTEKDG